MRTEKLGNEEEAINFIRTKTHLPQIMKRILSLAFLAMVAADPSATGTEGLSATGAASALTPAVTLIDNAITATQTASAKEKKLCKEETDATILWDKTVNTPEARAEAKGNREARMAAKKELAGALANRLKVLQAFLEKLYKSRQRLGGHIHRVNDMFQTVYGVNTQTQINAAETIKLLGISVSQPHSPMFKPIKLPKHEQDADAAEAASLDQDKDADPVAVAPEAAPEAAAATDSTTETVDPVTAETSDSIDASTADAKDEADAQENAVLDAEPASENAPADEKDEQLADATDLADASASSTDDADAAAPVSAASLMELEASINGCAGEDCNQAYTAAFALYKTTYLVNKENVQHFENERKALGGFRDGLKALIKKKEDKMAALAAQLKELMNAMANPGPTLESLFKMIKQHYDVTKTSCALMDGRSKTMLQLLSDPNNEGEWCCC